MRDLLISVVFLVLVFSHKDSHSEEGSSVKSSEQIIEEMLGTRGFGVKARAFLDVKFEYDSAQLTDEARLQLDQLAAALRSQELCYFRYELEGHTDSVGPDDYNQSLSEARALSAHDYLVNAIGLSAKRLTKSGHGESRPLNVNDGTAAENRRVEVVEIGEVEDSDYRCPAAN